MKENHNFITVQNRGLIAIPPEIRRRFGLEKPGALLEIIEREGEIALRPHIPIPADQAWFWSKRWQKMEGKVDEAISIGLVKQFIDAEEFLSDLDS